MKKIIYISFIILLASCGRKNTKEEKVQEKDTNVVSIDTSDHNGGFEKEESQMVFVDSSYVMGQTEVLNEKGQLDPNSSPQAVVQTIIKAAKTGKYGPLLKLSNPAVEMDGDAKDIINVSSKPKEDQKEFNDYFGNAKIVGKPRIKKNLAEVDIETNAEGGDKETIICENKYEKWYLKGL